MKTKLIYSDLQPVYLLLSKRRKSEKEEDWEENGSACV